MSSSPGVSFLVGSYSPSDRPAVYVFSLSPGSELTPRGTFTGIRNASFLAVHPGGNHLFAVSETGLDSDGRHGAVHAFRVERGDGVIELLELNSRSTEGDHPCHLSIDAEGRWLAAANYGTGSVAVFPILADGRLGPVASLARHAGSGPSARQEGPHAHSTVFTADMRFLITADLGIDRMITYAFDERTGSLTRHGETSTKPGAGPRHLKFHPEGEHVFVVNELDNSISIYEFDRVEGSLTWNQTLSTVPEGVADNTAADVHVSSSGTHVYVSNRGHDSLAVYEFDREQGLRLLAIRPCGGSWPRSFGITPDGRHLLVANRRSDDLVLLPLLEGGSEIGRPSARAAVSQPSCVTFL